MGCGWVDDEYALAQLMSSGFYGAGFYGPMVGSVRCSSVTVVSVERTDVVPPTGGLALRQPKMHGMQSHWPETLLGYYAKPTAKRLGIAKQIVWHSIRKTFATLLTKGHWRRR